MRGFDAPVAAYAIKSDGPVATPAQAFFFDVGAQGGATVGRHRAMVILSGRFSETEVQACDTCVVAWRLWSPGVLDSAAMMWRWRSHSRWLGRGSTAFAVAVFAVGRPATAEVGVNRDRYPSRYTIEGRTLFVAGASWEDAIWGKAGPDPMWSGQFGWGFARRAGRVESLLIGGQLTGVFAQGQALTPAKSDEAGSPVRSSAFRLGARVRLTGQWLLLPSLYAGIGVISAPVFAHSSDDRAARANRFVASFQLVLPVSIRMFSHFGLTIDPGLFAERAGWVNNDVPEAGWGPFLGLTGEFWPQPFMHLEPLLTN